MKAYRVNNPYHVLKLGEFKQNIRAKKNASKKMRYKNMKNSREITLPTI